MGTTATPTPGTGTSFWEKVVGFFHAAGRLVSEAFIKLFGKDAAQNFASASLAILKTDVGKIALEAVTEAAKVASGLEARNLAFGTVIKNITSIGLSAKDSEINMLIELALQAIKGSFGAVPAIAEPIAQSVPATEIRLQPLGPASTEQAAAAPLPTLTADPAGNTINADTKEVVAPKPQT